LRQGCFYHRRRARIQQAVEGGSVREPGLCEYMMTRSRCAAARRCGRHAALLNRPTAPARPRVTCAYQDGAAPARAATAERLATVAEVRDSLEASQGADYANFLRAFCQPLLRLLQTSPPAAAGTPEQRLRAAVLEVCSRCGARARRAPAVPCRRGGARRSVGSTAPAARGESAGVAFRPESATRPGESTAAHGHRQCSSSIGALPRL